MYSTKMVSLCRAVERDRTMGGLTCCIGRPLGHNPFVTVHGATSHACGSLLGERSLLLRSNDPGPLNFPIVDFSAVRRSLFFLGFLVNARLSLRFRCEVQRGPSLR